MHESACNKYFKYQKKYTNILTIINICSTFTAGRENIHNQKFTTAKKLYQN